MSTHRPVLIMEMPEQLNSVEARTFLQDLEPLHDSDRPRIVFDCSHVRRVDGAGREMMLHCLEEAMKRDRDLKLASLSHESKSHESNAVSELERVFEVFTTPDQAVRSFNAFPAGSFQNTSWRDTASATDALKKAS